LEVILKRTLIHVLMGLGVALLVSLLGLVWTLPQKVELSLYNQRMEALGKRQPNKQIVIIDIDEASVDRVGVWPWPRSIHAELLNKLHGWGAKVVGFDVYFLKQSNPQDDQALAQEIKAAGNVVLASMFSDQFVEKTGDENTEAKQALITPLEMFGGARAYVNYSHDLDGQIRRSSGLTRDGVDSFAYGIVKLWQPELAETLPGRYGTAPYLLHYSGQPQSYMTVSYANVLNDVLDPRVDPRLNRLVDVPPGVDPEKFSYKDLFKDKIVLIGASAINLHDVFDTPFVGTAEDGAKVRQMAGVEIHANHIDTLLNGDELTEAPGWQNIAVTVLVSVLFAAIVGFVGPLTGMLAALTVAIAYMTLNGFLFNAGHYVLNLVDPMLVLGADYGVLFAYRFFIEEKEKRRVRGTLNRYVSPKAVNELLKDEKAIPTLKSERRLVTILFSDIAGFTTMSEQMPVDEVERILNEYLTAMTQIVFDNDGTLDKYIGDAVMAVWGNVGATDPQGNALRAAKTAIEMQEKLAELRQKWLSEGMVPLQVRIGLNTGEALCGNFGSPLKMDFTVIGDTVNTASRLEGLNKDMNTNIMISHSTYELVKDYTTTRYLGPISAKGKAEKILVYELSGWRGGENDPLGAKTQAVGGDGTAFGRRLTKMGSTIFGAGTRTGGTARFGSRPPSELTKTQAGQTPTPEIGQKTQAGGRTMAPGLRNDFARTRANTESGQPTPDFGTTSPGIPNPAAEEPLADEQQT
jgi:adenylate cyclase